MDEGAAQGQPVHTPYFAYGSNLNAADWRRWCNDRMQYSGSGLALREPAVLQGYRLAFDYYSSVRAGGAANIVPGAHWHCVVGALFDVDEEAMFALDTKEGHPSFYRRTWVEVQTGSGEVVSAISYEVVPERKKATHQPPTAEYARLLREGLASMDLPTFHIDRTIINLDRDRGGEQCDSAICLSLGTPILHVFVYGTLMSGETRSACMDVEYESQRPKYVGPGRITGTLLNLGSYPGVIAGPGTVKGELYCVQCPAHVPLLLEVLDRIEGFRAESASLSLFRRVVVPVYSSRPRAIEWAYSYFYNEKYLEGDDVGEIMIGSGDWRSVSNTESFR